MRANFAMELEMTSFSSQITCIAFGLALAACATDKMTTGQLDLPIESVGTDGAMYHLPPNTRLSLAGQSIQNYDVGLDGDASVIDVKVAAGLYEATLYNTDNDYTTVWPLVRTDSHGTTTTIDATLLTAQPAGINIAP